MSAPTSESLGFWLAKAMDLLEDKLESEIATLDQRIEQKFTLRDSLAIAKHEGLSIAIKATEDAARLATESSNLAMVKAEGQAEKRWDAANEFRATLSDQAGRFATKDELNSLKERVSIMDGKDTGTADFKSASHQDRSLAVAVISALIALIALMAVFLHH